jgi:hypothetical protein
MSRHNKVNPDHYKVAGRLTADDLAREQRKQRGPVAAATRGRGATTRGRGATRPRRSPKAGGKAN